VATKITFAYPGDIDTLTGGYLYDKRVMLGLQDLGWDVHKLSLGDGFPTPSSHALDQAINQLMTVGTDQLLVIDGLALGSFGERAEALAKHHPYIALVHHPLAKESGLTPKQAKALFESEKPTLDHASCVVVTSPTTADTLMAEYNIPRHNILVVIPGLDRPPQRVQSTPAITSKNTPLQLLAVGALVPRKGFDVLLEALHIVADQDWSLTIVGDDSRSPQTTVAIKTQINALGLTSRVTLAGSLSPKALAEQYRCADVFVLASHYEGYGMAYAEALAWGLPVIGTTGGAVAQTVPTETGLLVAPGQPEVFAAALMQVLKDPIKRERMKLAAQRHGQQLPTWADTAQAFSQVLSRV
jgi:glycosyltransferase involved in cell wall biosynthesis